jgi:prepilin-type N-terminal cleavage/methylation domain-containing protein
MDLQRKAGGHSLLVSLCSYALMLLCTYAPARASKKRAFTLVEILIALAILAMIVASTFTIFRSASKSWQKGEIRSERYHNARTAIGRMSMEISQAVINNNSLCEFIGEKDSVNFISFVSKESGIFELAEIGYWLSKDKKLLMRNDDYEPDYDFSTYDDSDTLSDNVSELEFLYYDGLIWLDTWHSDKTLDINLPKAVKIRIKVDDKRSKEGETFEVIARLKTA